MAIKASHTQFETMLDFMERNSDIVARASSVGPHGRLATLSKWEELAALLNSDGSGLRKDVKKWQKTWSDWKYKVKSKAAKVRREIGGTGGGGKEEKDLTPLELRLLAIMGWEVVEGNGVLEAGLPIVEQPNCDEVYYNEEFLVEEEDMGDEANANFETMEAQLERPVPPEVEPPPARAALPAAAPLAAWPTLRAVGPPPARAALPAATLLAARATPTAEAPPPARATLRAAAPLPARATLTVVAPPPTRAALPTAAPLPARAALQSAAHPPARVASPAEEHQPERAGDVPQPAREPPPVAAALPRIPQREPRGRRRRTVHGGRNAVLDIQHEYVALRRAIEERTARDARLRMEVELENARARQAEADNMARLIEIAEALQPAILKFLEK